jgi:hypothetical protein
MRDGAPAHFTRAVRDILNNTYPNGWIGTGGLTAWPPRSSDLNPQDFCLLERLKTLLYASLIDSEETLHYRIVDGRMSDYPQLPRNL